VPADGPHGADRGDPAPDSSGRHDNRLVPEPHALPQTDPGFLPGVAERRRDVDRQLIEVGGGLLHDDLPPAELARAHLRYADLIEEAAALHAARGGPLGDDFHLRARAGEPQARRERALRAAETARDPELTATVLGELSIGEAREHRWERAAERAGQADSTYREAIAQVEWSLRDPPLPSPR
jgi:hypothetical protein